LPAERLNLLIQVAMQLTAERDLDRLLERIVDASARVVHADRGSLYLADWDGYYIISRVAQRTQAIRMPIGTGIAGRVAETGMAVRVDDAYDCPYFNPDVDRLSGYHTMSVLCVPMVSALGRRIGAVQVLNKMTDGGFTDDDELLLSAFASQAAIAIDNAQRHDENERLLESVMRTMARTIDHRDYITGGHSTRVTDYSMMMVRAMGVTNPSIVRAIRCAAMLHDYGKIGVSEAVLTKPGELTEEEFREMRLHVVFTREILATLDLPRDLATVPQIAAEHHERLDGSGYPEGLTEDRLSLGGRIIAVADVFDALSSQRQYRAPMDPQRLMNLLKAEAGIKLDDLCVRALVEAMPEIVGKWGHGAADHFERSYGEGLVECSHAMG
jgi:putative methionine-R-sulfoxide reductase with GAF domain